MHMCLKAPWKNFASRRATHLVFLETYETLQLPLFTFHLLVYASCGWNDDRRSILAWSCCIQRKRDKPDKNRIQHQTQNHSRLPNSFKFSGVIHTCGPIEIMVSNKSVPGPGAYDTKSSISKDGHTFVSKFKDSGARSIAPPSLKRSASTINVRLTFIVRDGFFSSNNVPGPGAYSPKTQLSDRGTYYITGFKSSQGRSFGHAMPRATSSSGFGNVVCCRILPPIGTANVPGPGSYRLPSDFGYTDVAGAKSMGLTMRSTGSRNSELGSMRLSKKMLSGNNKSQTEPTQREEPTHRQEPNQETAPKNEPTTESKPELTKDQNTEPKPEANTQEVKKEESKAQEIKVEQTEPKPEQPDNSKEVQQTAEKQEPEKKQEEPAAQDVKEKGAAN